MAYRNITSLLSRLTLRRPNARIIIPLRQSSLWRPSWWDRSPMSDIGHTFENELRRLQREMDNVFSSFHERPWYNPFSSFRPFHESEEQTICEEDGVKKLRLKFDVRRFKPQEISVKTSGNKLTIEAKQHVKDDKMESKYDYKRMFTLPDGVKAETVECRYVDGGYLLVEAPYEPPKSESADQPITVKHE
ncbi:HSP20 domain containing protein [Trichuris trichiura]|uniref:HSP20 domain containing protein n=1 Tax=Trichuris trichiura TaxID=36087 RepID=A0A077YWR4_TRITR|nr:HSP20 domain containing protein [Trichuris trichiura]